MGIDRLYREDSMTIGDGASASGAFADVAAYTMFAVFAPTGTEGTHLQFLEDYEDAAKAAKDEAASLKIVAFTVNQWVDAPVACASMHKMHLKTCSAADGTAQAQTGAATLTLRCKG